MSHDPFRDRLSDYVDGELSVAEQGELEAHLGGCSDCRSVVTELGSLRRRARSLPPVEPPEHVWPAIAARLSSEPTGTSRRSSFHTALAAAAALVLGVSLWIAVAPRQPDVVDDDPEALAAMVTEELRAAEAHYEKAITGLEQIIARNEGSLPADLDQTLNENLDLIEGTIAESRNAIAANPGSVVAQESLLEAFRRKVTLLRNTILLINEIRKGEGENALDLIDEIRESDDPSNPI